MRNASRVTLAAPLQFGAVNMRPLRWVVLLAAILTTPIFAAVRLTYDFGGKATPVAWPSTAFPLQYTVDRRVADKFGIDAVDRAFNAWTSIPDANITFHDAGVGDVAKAGQDGVNTVSVLDGLFKDQGFIAVTTNWYDTSGSMTEADIQIDSSQVGTSYPALATIEHEVGPIPGEPAHHNARHDPPYARYTVRDIAQCRSQVRP